MIPMQRHQSFVVPCSTKRCEISSHRSQPLSMNTGPGQRPKDSDLDEASRLILAGRPPPIEWWHLIIELDFTETKLKDLRPLIGLRNLARLLLRDTQVTDLSPLAGLTNLEHLNLMGTQVT